jgi:hypothetical protein
VFLVVGCVQLLTIGEDCSVVVWNFFPPDSNGKALAPTSNHTAPVPLPTA